MFGEIHLFQQHIDAFFSLGFAQTRKDRQVIHGLPHIHRRVHRKFLGQIPDDFTNISGIFNGNPTHHNFPISLLKQRCQCLHQRGFSSSIAPQQPKHAWMDRKIYIIQRLFLSIKLIQVFDLNRMIHLNILLSSDASHI